MQTKTKESAPIQQTDAGVGHLATAVAVKKPEAKKPKTTIAQLYDKWHKNQMSLDVSGFTRNKKLEIIEENNNIRTKFIGLYMSKDKPAERDVITKAIYASLPSAELKNSLVSNGLISGIVAEISVYEQLSKIQGCEARLSTTDEDVHDGFDIALDLPSGRSIYVDAKSHIPKESTVIDGFYSYNFGVKSKPTRDGSPVFVVCPNPPEYKGTRFLSEIQLPDGNRLPSFKPNEDRRDPSQLADVFVKYYQLQAQQAGTTR